MRRDSFAAFRSRPGTLANVFAPLAARFGLLWRKQALRCAVGAVAMLLVAAQLLTVGFGDRRAQRFNRLQFNAAAPREVRVPLLRMTPSSVLTRRTLSGLRKNALALSPAVVSLDYKPATLLFKLVDDSAPWTPAPGFYQDQAGLRLEKQMPSQALGLVNPLLLVTPVFKSLQREAQTQPAASFPVYPSPVRLTFEPAERRAAVFYDLTELGVMADPQADAALNLPLGVAAYNAFDFGFSVLALSPDESMNISSAGSPPFPTHSLFGSVEDGCGPGKTCNRLLTRSGPYSDLKIKALPARAAFKLWRKPPLTGREKEDFLFVIRVR